MPLRASSHRPRIPTRTSRTRHRRPTTLTHETLSFKNVRHVVGYLASVGLVITVMAAFTLVNINVLGNTYVSFETLIFLCCASLTFAMLLVCIIAPRFLDLRIKVDITAPVEQGWRAGFAAGMFMWTLVAIQLVPVLLLSNTLGFFRSEPVQWVRLWITCGALGSVVGSFCGEEKRRKILRVVSIRQFTICNQCHWVIRENGNHTCLT